MTYQKLGTHLPSVDWRKKNRKPILLATLILGLTSLVIIFLAGNTSMISFQPGLNSFLCQYRPLRPPSSHHRRGLPAPVWRRQLAPPVHPTIPRYFSNSNGQVVYLTVHTWQNLVDTAKTNPLLSLTQVYLDFLEAQNHLFRLWAWSRPNTRFGIAAPTLLYPIPLSANRLQPASMACPV
jgi:hypothetical protein